jgi:uncharacterized protein (DUF427 family)
MKAVWSGSTIAEAADENVIYIEGNCYFPPDALKERYFTASEHRTTCHWKGEAHYYDVHVAGRVNEFGAWYYPRPIEESIKRVKKDFSRYVAFWNGVQIVP